MSNTLNNITPLANDFDTQSILSVPQTDTMSGKYVLVNDGSGKPWVMPASLFFDAANQAELAANAANQAAGSVDAAITEAETAASSANQAATRANQAATGVEQAISNANTAAGQAATAAESASTAGGKANAAATAANTAAVTAGNAADDATAAAGQAATASLNAESAATLAREVADHPTYIGYDGFVYVWNTATKKYDKTDIYVKGEPFKITIKYYSVADMEEDYNNSDVPVGSYVMIQTETESDPDNLKVFLKGSERFEYIGYMFGSGGGSDVENAQIPFNIASVRESLLSGSPLPVLFGQVSRWLTDLKALAFKDKVNWATDVDGRPVIPAEQIQSDYAQTDINAKDYIKNKPTIPSGQIPSDWNQIDPLAADFIKNKPIIPDEYDDTAIRQEIADNLVSAKNYTNDQIAQIVQFDITVVSSLPATGIKGTIYLVPKEGSGNDVHNEYIWNETGSKFELIGSTSIDLSGYYTMVQADAKFALKTDIENAYYLDITPLYSGDGFVSETTTEFLQSCAQAVDNKCVAIIDHETPFPGWVQSLTDKYVIVLNTSTTLLGVYHPNNITISVNKTTKVVSVEQTDNLPESGGALVLGSFRLVGATSTEEQMTQVLNGHTFNEIQNAILSQKPIYTILNTPANPLGFAAIKSAVVRVDGSLTYIYMIAEYYNGRATPSDYCLEKRLFMSFDNTTGALTGMSALGKLLSGYDSLTYSQIPFNGGSVFGFITNNDGTWTPKITFPHGWPNDGDETSIIMVNSFTEPMVWSALTLGADAPAAARIVIIDDFVTIKQDEAVEINIKYMNRVFSVRISSPFNYNS